MAEEAVPSIPDHEMIRPVGRGSYGEVWLARTVLGTFRGVKLIFRKTFDQERPYEREFLGIQQYEPVSRTHRGLVGILQIGRNDRGGYFYYVMEAADDLATGPAIEPQRYVPKTLKAEMQARGRIAVEECLSVGAFLADALAHLHGAGLIHRDVKPANVIYVGGVPKIADIGLVAKMDEPNSLVGTLGYMPPEGPGGATTDLYGLGKVLYEMATGQTRDHFPELPTDMLEGLEAVRFMQLNRILLKACANDPGERYRSGEEMGKDLRQVQSGGGAPRTAGFGAGSGSTRGAEREVDWEGHELESIGGAVPLESKFYVERPADRDFQRALDRRDSIVLIKGARQVGKTSLLARGLQHARERRARVVLTDFQKLDASHLASVGGLFLKLGEFLSDQLALDVLPSDVWDERRGPNTNFERYLRREVLGSVEGHLVWGMDEVDRLFGCSFGSDVFGLLRSWHNERALDPSGPWSRLTLAIAYATEAHLFITDINQSPFNVGTRLFLEDFNLEQIKDLNERYGGVLDTQEDLRALQALTGGHPYLVRQALNELASGTLGFEDFKAKADGDEGIFGDHLRRMTVLLARDQVLSGVVRGILDGKPVGDATSFYRLRSAGLMVGDGPDRVRPRCKIYESYLRRHVP